MIMPVVFPRVYERATSWLHDYDPGVLPARGHHALPARTRGALPA
ncbi:hypothetical protein [Frankia sp. QA3]|nr:hypothetical protein [Frankia sp. QA3]